MVAKTSLIIVNQLWKVSGYKLNFFISNLFLGKVIYLENI